MTDLATILFDTLQNNPVIRKLFGMDSDERQAEIAESHLAMNAKVMAANMGRLVSSAGDEAKCVSILDQSAFTGFGIGGSMVETGMGGIKY